MTRTLEAIATHLDFRNDFKGQCTISSEYTIKNMMIGVGRGAIGSSKLVYRLGGLGAAAGAVYGAVTGDFDMGAVRTGWAYGTLADMAQISIRGGIKLAQKGYNRLSGSNQEY